MNDDSQNAVVRVLVVDDQALMRDGLASLLSLEHGITVAGPASNAEETVQQVAALEPDVILMDVRMPVLDGVAAMVQIRRGCRRDPTADSASRCSAGVSCEQALLHLGTPDGGDTTHTWALQHHRSRQRPVLE